MKKILSTVIFLFFFQISYAADGMVVLVYPFQNTGPDKYSWLSAGMTDSVISDLGRVKSIKVISDSDRKNAVKEAALGQTGLLNEKAVNDLGKLTGANTVITGSYSVNGGKVKVKVKIIPVGKPGGKRTFQSDGTVDEIFDLQDKIVYGLLNDKGKTDKASPITGDEKKSINNKYKPKLSAYELYSKGWDISGKNPQGALEFYNQAIAADPGYAAPLVEAGWITGTVLNRYSDSLNYLRKAEAILIKNNDTSSVKYASMLNTMGAVSSSTGQADTAISYYLKAKTALENSGKQNTFMYGNLLVNIGNAYQNKNNMNEALEYYVLSKKLFESLQLQKSINYAVLLCDIGDLCREGNQPDAALKYYGMSKEIYDAAADRDKYHGYAQLMVSMGMFYSDNKNDTVTGMGYYKKADDLYKASGLTNTSSYAALMFQMGTSEALKDDRLALSYYDRGRAIYENLGISSTYNFGALIWNTAIAYQNLNNKQKAGENYRKACIIFKNIGNASQSMKADERARQLGY